MGSLTTAGENLALAWMFTTTDMSASRPTTWFIGLHTEDPTEVGNVGELTTSEYASYVRKAVTFDTPVEGRTASADAVAWDIDSSSLGFTVTHASIWDSLSGGTCLIKSELVKPREMIANGLLAYNIGEIVAIFY